MKITMPMLDIYAKFAGDSDYLARCATAEDKAAISDEQWGCIYLLMQEAFLLQRAHVTPEYRRDIEERLINFSENHATLERIKEMAVQSESGTPQ